MKKFVFCPYCRSKLLVGNIEGGRRRYCPGCGWINYINPVPVVAVIVSDRCSRLLLVKRSVAPHKGRWSLPGGFLESGEGPVEAGRRELFEETGLLGDFSQLVGVCSQRSSQYGSVMVTGISFAVDRFELSPGDDASDARFFTLKKLPEIPFSCHRKMVELYRKRGYGLIP
jgi:ADP-ribose pyrophosphatase YjhB (NUDIX family)